MDESQAKTKMCRIASEMDRERHRSFFQTTNVGELEVNQSSRPPATGDQWEIVSEWDTVPEAFLLKIERLRSWFDLGRGYTEEDYQPKFVTWRPKTSQVYTFPDHVNGTLWNMAGEVCSTRGVKARHGYYSGVVLREYWADHADWFLCFGQPWHYASADGCSVYSAFADRAGWFVNDFGRFGISDSTPANVGPSPAFNPWRPFSAQFVMRSYQHGFKLCGIGAPNKETDSSLRVEQVMDISALDPEDRNIESYLWHPSGRYLAYVSCVTNESTRQRVYRVNLLDWDAAQIVASTQSLVWKTYQDVVPRCYSWSPGGQLLVLDAKLSMVWDVQAATISKMGEEEHSRWVQRLRAATYADQHNGRGYAYISSDGERSLVYNQSNIAVVGTQSEMRCVLSKGARNAAWHPTDPNCFTTVGGDGSERMVRIWRLKGT